MNHRNRHRAKTLEYLSIARGDTVVTASRARSIPRGPGKTMDSIVDMLKQQQEYAEIKARAKRQKKGKSWIAAQLEKRGYTDLAATVRSS